MWIPRGGRGVTLAQRARRTLAHFPWPCLSMSNASPQRGALAALAGTILIWAYSWVVMKQALTWAGPFDFAALRYLFGAAVLFGALLASRQSLRPPPLVPTVLIGLCQTAAFQGLEQW